MRSCHLVKLACLLLALALISVELASGRVLLAAERQRALDMENSNTNRIVGVAVSASKVSLSPQVPTCNSETSSSECKLHFQKLPRGTKTPARDGVFSTYALFLNLGARTRKWSRAPNSNAGYAS
ncbi:hypothetical protein R1sor_001994 [Riccia sorocarpa]|uniref:Uncharacterized protein n=1 Tax=Riccia sorocarpa TaxID=122646 RepID=A0ABD3GXI1_9MARC